MIISVQPCSPADKKAQSMSDELSQHLFEITGNDGRHSFAEDDVLVPGSLFLVAEMDGEPVGCGGLRPITEDVCEIKRMYAKTPGMGIGAKLLDALEEFALQYGYRQIWLETRKVNLQAVNFYLRRGYKIREKYGKYVGREEAVCFEKSITS
jgi:ribosomal protein S18 acetylase RimI-like enzyme